ncbi:hypothetical protein EUGRSUZ_J00287 [Eucalyptus grandis]|uniref:Uncharacterized protein n=2 Tax=Eucalyptus grandis TaxID=71139 RepID=A0ACC3J2W8_EUCGR|nr:hypothetical protein EUGRSUZ_J00287 [Eucalyptus grandis]
MFGATLGGAICNLACKAFHVLLQRGTIAAVVKIVEKPWERVYVDGQPHEHGFKLGSEKHTTEVTVKKTGALKLTSGIAGLSVLKTTMVS